MAAHRRLKKKFIIPIYGATLWLVVADRIADERRKMEHSFGKLAGDPDDYDALCSHSGGCTFGLFFNRKTLNIQIMAHEVFHLTHRILEWASCNFDKEHHEQGALLHGYLMELVWRELKA